MVRVYFNTSILVRAVDPSASGHYDALLFIELCKRRGYVLVFSSIHLKERWRPETWRRIRFLFKRYGFRGYRVSLGDVLGLAINYVDAHGISRRHLLDIAHIHAARILGCKYIAAIDRFIRAHASEFNLAYINYYTGCPS